MANNDHMPTSEIKQDIKDTQIEVDDFRDEKAILMKKPQQYKVRIYMLEGQISSREIFIKQLKKIIEKREEI